MRWFHHDTGAHADVKIQMLMRDEGLAGLGAFWTLLEVIGRESASFRVKIEDPPGLWRRLLGGRERARANEWASRSESSPADGNIPTLSLWCLARMLHTHRARLRRIIRTSVELGLFDRREWEGGRILYSRGFELRADEYTRRAKRAARSRGSESTVRTLSGHSPVTIFPEQNREQQIDTDKNRTAERDGAALGTPAPPGRPGRGQAVIDAADMDGMYQEFSNRLNEFLGCWAESHNGSVPWRPEREHLLSLWRVALRIAPRGENRTGEVEAGVNTVLAAVQNMFDESTRREIRSPPAYLAASLLGTHAGTQPWIR